MLLEAHQHFVTVLHHQTLLEAHLRERSRRTSIDMVAQILRRAVEAISLQRGLGGIWQCVDTRGGLHP
eukprot:5769270-Heterocapsa_arctica.AAC.1